MSKKWSAAAAESTCRLCGGGGWSAAQFKCPSYKFDITKKKFKKLAVFQSDVRKIWMDSRSSLKINSASAATRQNKYSAATAACQLKINRLAAAAARRLTRLIRSVIYCSFRQQRGKPMGFLAAAAYVKVMVGGGGSSRFLAGGSAGDKRRLSRLERHFFDVFSYICYCLL